MSAGPVTIAGVVLSAAQLASAIDQSVVAPKDPDDELQSYRRWVQCTIRNETQFDMMYIRDYMEGGMLYEDPPSLIGKFSSGTFSAYNDDIFSGVLGGNSWELVLDDNNVFKFSLGYIDPMNKGGKSAAIESEGDPQDGFYAATEEGTSGKSNTYEGKDADGNETRFIIELTSMTGPCSIYTIRQSVVEG